MTERYDEVRQLPPAAVRAGARLRGTVRRRLAFT
jgi:hypothetical protein